MVFPKDGTIFQRCPKSLHKNWVFRPFCPNYAVVVRNRSRELITRKLKEKTTPLILRSKLMTNQRSQPQGKFWKLIKAFFFFSKNAILSLVPKNAVVEKLKLPPFYFWKKDKSFSTSRPIFKSKAFFLTLFPNFMPKWPDDGQDIRRFLQNATR